MQDYLDLTTPATLLGSTVSYLGAFLGGYKDDYDGDDILNTLFTAEPDSECFWEAYQELRDLYNRAQGAAVVSGVIAEQGLLTTVAVRLDRQVPYIEVNGIDTRQDLSDTLNDTTDALNDATQIISVLKKGQAERDQASPAKVNSLVEEAEDTPVRFQSVEDLIGFLTGKLAQDTKGSNIGGIDYRQ